MLAKLGLLVVFVGILWYGCLTQVNGRRIGIGDSRARVIRLLGEPEVVFTPQTSVNKNGSYLVS